MTKEICSFFEDCLLMEKGECKITLGKNCELVDNNQFHGRCSVCGKEGPVKKINDNSRVCDKLGCTTYIESRQSIMRGEARA